MKRPFKPDWLLPFLLALLLTMGIMRFTSHPNNDWEIWAKVIVGPFLVYAAVFNLTTAILRRIDKGKDE